MVVPAYSLMAQHPPPSPGSKWVSKYCCNNWYHRGANRHTFHHPRQGSRGWCVFHVADWDMGSAGALTWTLFLRSCLRVGRLTSGMVSIEQCGPRISRYAFGWETTTDGVLASRISNACTSTEPGGGGLAASTRTNKPACVWPLVNPRQPVGLLVGSPIHRWVATRSHNRRNRSEHQPARRSIAQVDTAVRDIRIVSESGLVPSPTEVSEVRRDMGQMRPDGQGKGLRWGPDVLLG